MNVLCIIPARGGSKKIPQKNIKLFCGKPLLYWTIKQAHESKRITRTILSSNDPEIIRLAKSYGCEVPFVRPEEISQDMSPDVDFMKHALEWFKKNEPNYQVDIIVQLRPTSPCRDALVIDKCIDIFAKTSYNLEKEGLLPLYDSLRTVVLNKKPPYKMYTITHGDTTRGEGAGKEKSPILNPMFECVNGIDEPYNKARQSLPATYWHNGYVDLILPSVILLKNSMSGDKIYPYVLDQSQIHDIDTLDEWVKAEKYFSQQLLINRL